MSVCSNPQTPASFNSLHEDKHDHIVLAIFLKLDIVTRKRAAKVCTRWYRFLSDRRNRPAYLRIDLRHLASVQKKPTDLQHRFLATVSHIQYDIMLSKTIVVTDESNSDKPWLTDKAESNGESTTRFHPKALIALVREIFDTDVLDYFAVPCVVLEKLALRGEEVLEFLLQLNGQNGIRVVEFRNVKVQGPGLFDNRREDRYPHEMVRRIDYGRIVCGRFEEPQQQVAKFMELLGQDDLPLTDAEELLFLHVFNAIRWRILYPTFADLSFSIKKFFGVEWDGEQPHSAMFLTSFMKRLIAAEQFDYADVLHV